MPRTPPGGNEKLGFLLWPCGEIARDRAKRHKLWRREVASASQAKQCGQGLAI
jgi:hypothetical protein